MTSASRTRLIRASSRFTLFGFDELGPGEQEALAGLTEDPDFYGILKPASALLPSKSVSKQGALLLLALQSPQRIRLLQSIFGDDPSLFHMLLADGVLEVEHDSQFVSGPDAVRLVQPARDNTPATHPLVALSCAAIECAAAYEELDIPALAERLYAFGRLPCTPHVRHRFACDEDLLSFLVSDSSTRNLLGSTWDMIAAQGEPWLAWSRRHEVHYLEYKLYVSARLEAMPTLFAMMLRAMHRTECRHFKIGRRGEGVCRPDKMVAYFASLDALRACASLIEAELAAAGTRSELAHGVPFTAGIDPAGFLSWGMDPPDLEHAAPTSQRQSFRHWLSQSVATAVHSARVLASPGDVVPFVLSRIELDGIDTRTWAPRLAIWRGRARNPAVVA
jgi:hypothetical protein